MARGPREGAAVETPDDKAALAGRPDRAAGAWPSPLIGPTTNPTTFGPSSGGFIPLCSGFPAWKCLCSVVFRQRPRRATRS